MTRHIREYRDGGRIIDFKDYEEEVTRVLLQQGSLEAMESRRRRLVDEQTGLESRLLKLESVWRMRSITLNDYSHNSMMIKAKLEAIGSELICLGAGIAEARRIESDRKCEEGRVKRDAELDDLRATEPMLRYMSCVDLRTRLDGEMDELEFLREMVLRQECRVEMFAGEVSRRSRQEAT